MRQSLFVVVLLAACASHRDAWRDLTTRDLDCAPHQFFIESETLLEVPIVQGFVHEHGMLDPVPDVRVALRPLGSSKAIAVVTTDPAGRFAFPSIGEGMYQLDTCSAAYNSTVVAVHVSRRAPRRDIELDVRPGT